MVEEEDKFEKVIREMMKRGWLTHRQAEMLREWWKV